MSPLPAPTPVAAPAAADSTLLVLQEQIRLMQKTIEDMRNDQKKGLNMLPHLSIFEIDQYFYSKDDDADDEDNNNHSHNVY